MNFIKIKSLDKEIALIEKCDTSSLGCGDQDHMHDVLNSLREEREELLIGDELSNRYHRVTFYKGEWIYQTSFDGAWFNVDKIVLENVKEQIATNEKA